MANFRSINKPIIRGGAQTADGPPRVTILSAAGIVLAVTIFFFSA